MLKKLFFALVGVSLLVGSIVYIKLGQFSAMGEAAEKMVLPPTTVNAVTVSKDSWEQFLSATGSISAVQGVIVSAEASGRISEIRFDSGDTVEAGQVLLQLDTKTEDSELASAQATAALARTERSRFRKLVKNNLSSKDELDRAEAEVKETVARVGVIKAQIEKKTIRAPFGGRLGLRQVNLGQVLSVGDPIVVLQMLNQVYVDFSIPQQNLSLLKRGMIVRIRSDAVSDESFQGEISAINVEMDRSTRNVHVQALVDNPQEKLRVGMFVNTEVVLSEPLEVLPVPLTAIYYAPFGNSVFVVDEQKNKESGLVEKVLRQQFVSLGQTRGDYVDVTDGLKPGETVVTSGVFKLRAGMSVVIDNTLSPEFSLSPKPSDS